MTNNRASPSARKWLLIAVGLGILLGVAIFWAYGSVPLEL